MTTGRINQVTILSPGAAVGHEPGVHPPLEGGGALRELEIAGATPAGRDHHAGRGGRRPTIQLPPLSSPKGGPPRGYRVEATTKPHGMHPSGGGSPPPDQRPRAATGVGTPPEGLGCE
jgi:hypothetical protein